jgi:hypothetical protein
MQTLFFLPSNSSFCSSENNTAKIEKNELTVFGAKELSPEPQNLLQNSKTTPSYS